MEDCLFCKIIRGEIPSKIAYEDETVFAFHDIDPQAPVHILIIPKKHLKSMLELTDDDTIASHLFTVARKLAKEHHLEENGFRVVINTGKDGGQTVEHLHLHLLGGRGFGWPPG